MNKRILLLLLAILTIPAIYFAFFRTSEPAKVLVYSKTAGYRHASIEDGKIAIMAMGKENGFVVDTTEDAGMFQESVLKNYQAVVFLSTTQDVLNDVQQVAFQRFIQAGGGFVGIHAAADTEYDWPWYGQLVGAYFVSHPKTQEAEIKVLDNTHSATKALPMGWKRIDEWYNYKNISEDINILLNLDESSYEGGTLGKNHPIAWYHEFDGGRAFYTGLGHTPESFREPLFLKHLLGGIQYALAETSSTP